MDETFDERLFDKILREVMDKPNGHRKYILLNYEEAALVTARYCKACDKESIEGPDDPVIGVSV